MNLKKLFICFFLIACSCSENESLPIENTTTSVITSTNSQNSSTESLFCPPCQRNNDFSSYDDLSQTSKQVKIKQRLKLIL